MPNLPSGRYNAAELPLTVDPFESIGNSGTGGGGGGGGGGGNVAACALMDNASTQHVRKPAVGVIVFSCLWFDTKLGDINLKQFVRGVARQRKNYEAISIRLTPEIRGHASCTARCMFPLID